MDILEPIDCFVAQVRVGQCFKRVRKVKVAFLVEDTDSLVSCSLTNPKYVETCRDPFFVEFAIIVKYVLDPDWSKSNDCVLRSQEMVIGKIPQFKRQGEETR